jgi:hypothetical protein
MSPSAIRLALLQNFWQKKMTALEQKNNRHPLALGPLSTTLALKDIVRTQAREFHEVLYQKYPN